MKIALFFATAAIASMGSAQVVAKGSSYLLRYQYTPGKTYTILVKTASTVVGLGLDPRTGQKSDKPISQNVDIPIKIKVVSVKGEIATLAVTVTPMGPKGKGGEPQTNQVQVNRRGQIVGNKEASLDNIGMFLYPEKAIGIGATWEGTATAASGGMPAMTVKTTYTFAGVKSVNGKKYAVITAKGKSTGFMTADVVSNYQVAAGDGFLLHSTTNLKGTMANPQTKKPLSLTVKATMNRG